MTRCTCRHRLGGSKPAAEADTEWQSERDMQDEELIMGDLDLNEQPAGPQDQPAKADSDMSDVAAILVGLQVCHLARYCCMRLQLGNMSCLLVVLVSHRHETLGRFAKLLPQWRQCYSALWLCRCPAGCACELPTRG